MNILYIDDDAEDREFFREALYALDPDIICHTAKDGADGMRTLQDLMVMPDFIFVDVNMPVMNGKEFLQQIKKMVRFRSIPVIVYSTTTQTKELEVYQKLGAFRVLAKPASLRGITQLIQNVLTSYTVGQRQFDLARSPAG